MVKTRSSIKPKWNRNLPKLIKKSPQITTHNSSSSSVQFEEEKQQHIENETPLINSSEQERKSSSSPSFDSYLEDDDDDGLGEDDEQNLAGIIQSITQDFSNEEEDCVSSYEDVLDPEFMQLFARGSNNVKKIVHFNDRGQPIGENAAAFGSDLGLIMRKHCPICFENWKDVPPQIKEMLWKLVTDIYVVSLCYKRKVLDRIQKYWRSYKSTTRIKYYDSYDTDEERKRNRPPGIRQDVWNIFVDNQSSPTAQARRIAGKLARQAVKHPHVTGRLGAARIEEALQKENPSATVTRTDIYLALHSRKDGSCPTPELAEKVKQIKAIAHQNPTSVNLDINHDPVAQVYGPDRSRHFVRGMGFGVSKKSLVNSAHVIELLRQERSLRIATEDQIADIEEHTSAPTVVEQTPRRVTRSRTLREANLMESNKQTTCSNKKKKRFAEHERTKETSVPGKKKTGKKQRVESEKEPDTDLELEGSFDTESEHEDDFEDDFALSEEQAPGREIVDSVPLGSENTEKKVVHFNDKGQPIGEEAKHFNSYLITIMRKHCPISYQKWKDVPIEIKNTVWNLVTPRHLHITLRCVLCMSQGSLYGEIAKDEFLVAEGFRHKVLQKVQNYWRRHKSVLRIKHYDCYNSDETRKENCPTFVCADDWKKFVDNESLPVARARREVGRSARQKSETPNHSGKRGAARIEEKLKKGNPLATVTRTDLYLAMHQGLSTENEKVEKVKAIVRENPESVNFDLDLDPVAQVYGSKKKNYVVGMGQGVTRKSLIDAAPVMERLQRERMLRLSAEQKLASLKQQQGGECPVATPLPPSPSAAPPPPSPSASHPPPSVVEQTRPEEEVSGVSELEKLRQRVVLQDEKIGALQEEKAQITDLKEQITSQGLMIADMKELIMRLCS